MLSISDLADAINDAIGALDGDGNPIATTSEMTAYATAIVNTLQAAVLNNAPGTVTATGTQSPPPTGVTDGAASNGLITLNSAVWQAALTSGFPTADPGKLSVESSASTGYLMGSSTVSFASGNITGICTATAQSPGNLSNGAGSNGTLDGPSGNPWASAVTGSQGLPSSAVAQAIYAACSDYIKNNVVAAYPQGSVSGSFIAGGGPMTLGTGIGGTLS